MDRNPLPSQRHWQAPATSDDPTAVDGHGSDKARHPFPMQDGDWWGARERFDPRALHRLSFPVHVPDPLFDQVSDVVIASGLLVLLLGIVAVLS